jgi:hypothetical protein
MKVEKVEIYSDASNLAVMRHPGRHLPGSLIQGDTLHSLCVSADRACEASKKAGCSDAFEEINYLRNALWERLNHYEKVLTEHGIQIPYSRSVA